MISLNRMINLHKNKVEDKHLKTKNMETFVEDEEIEVEDKNEEEERKAEKETPLTRKRKGRGRGVWVQEGRKETQSQRV